MKILHLYYDIMNLYGDYANVAAMKRMLEKNGEEVTVDKLTLGGDIRFDEYDFVFVGSGTERNLRVVLEDLRRHTEGLKAYIDSGKTALFTGNSFEMLGKALCDSTGKTVDGLGIFDFTTAEQNKTRWTSDVIYSCDFLTQPLVGFVNKCSEIKGVSNAPFTAKMGLSNVDGDCKEGVRDKNFFGTHLTGPVLIKNPHFLAYLAEKVLGRAPETDYLTFERAGFDVTLCELSKRMGNA